MKKLLIAAIALFTISLNAQDLEKSLLWKVSGNGITKPSYLFGTIHITCDATLDESVLKALDETEQLYLELDMDDPAMKAGMMGGMMGPGTMGYGPLPADLTAEQRRQLAEIHREFRARQWPLMQQMHELMWDEGAPSDEQAQRRAYDKFAALHKQMFENRLAMRKRIDALLTPQQRESLRGGARPPR